MTPADETVLGVLLRARKPLALLGIADRAGFPPQRARECLSRLESWGKVRLEGGAWRLPPRPKRTLPALLDDAVVEIPPPSEPVTVCVTLGDWWAPVTLRPSGRHEVGRAQHGGRWVRDVPADVGVALVQAALERAA